MNVINAIRDRIKRIKDKIVEFTKGLQKNIKVLYSIRPNNHYGPVFN